MYHTKRKFDDFKDLLTVKTKFGEMGKKIRRIEGVLDTSHVYLGSEEFNSVFEVYILKNENRDKIPEILRIAEIYKDYLIENKIKIDVIEVYSINFGLNVLEE